MVSRMSPSRSRSTGIAPRGVAIRVPEAKQGTISTTVVVSVVGDSTMPSVTDRVMPVVIVPPGATWPRVGVKTSASNAVVMAEGMSAANV